MIVFKMEKIPYTCAQKGMKMTHKPFCKSPSLLKKKSPKSSQSRKLLRNLAEFCPSIPTEDTVEE